MPSGKALIINTMIRLISKRISSESSSCSPMKHRQLHAAALLSKSGRLIGMGENRYGAKNYNTIKDSSYLSIDSIHSENDCIKKNIGKVKQNKSLIMLVLRPNGGNSRPCYRCANDINNQGNIKRVYYTDINDDSERIVRYESIESLMNPDKAHYSKFQKFQNSSNDTSINNSCSNDDCSDCSGDCCGCSDNCDDCIGDCDDEDSAKPNLAYKKKVSYFDKVSSLK